MLVNTDNKFGMSLNSCAPSTLDTIFLLHDRLKQWLSNCSLFKAITPLVQGYLFSRNYQSSSRARVSIQTYAGLMHYVLL